MSNTDWAGLTFWFLMGLLAFGVGILIAVAMEAKEDRDNLNHP